MRTQFCSFPRDNPINPTSDLDHFLLGPLGRLHHSLRLRITVSQFGGRGVVVHGLAVAALTSITTIAEHGECIASESSSSRIDSSKSEIESTISYSQR